MTDTTTDSAKKLQAILDKSQSEFENSSLGRARSSGILSSSIAPQSGSITDGLTDRLHFTAADMPYVSPPPQQQQQQSGGSVICTKFYQLGLCEKEIYRAEHKWGIDLWKNEASGMHGYYWWGIPFAKQLTRKTWQGRLLIKIMYPLFNAIALETASRYGVYRDRTITTRIIGKVGSFILVNFCRFMGKVRILVEGNASVASV